MPARPVRAPFTPLYDGNSENHAQRRFDLSALNAASEVRAKDVNEDPMPVVFLTTASANACGLRIHNVRSNGRSLILTARLDLESGSLD